MANLQSSKHWTLSLINWMQKLWLRRALHPDLAEKLLPIFKVNAKARRVTLNYEDGGQSKQLHITVRKDLTFVVHQAIKQNVKTTQADLQDLKQIRESNEFVLIPAARDATSASFQNLFGDMLRKHALAKMIPKKAGGTPKEYRTLKEIRDSITGTISPYIDEKLLPEIEKYFGFTNQHKLALKFGVDVQQIGEWILNNLKLGFKLKDDEEATLVLTEAAASWQNACATFARCRKANALARRTRLRRPQPANPNGIESFSPALPKATLGSRSKTNSTPTGLPHRFAPDDATLSGLINSLER